MNTKPSVIALAFLEGFSDLSTAAEKVSVLIEVESNSSRYLTTADRRARYDALLREVESGNLNSN